MPAGYKQTEVGVIPEDWKLPTLNTLVDSSRGIRYGIVQPGKYDPKGRFMVRGQDYSKGWVDPSELFRVSPRVEEPFVNARIRVGDILVTIVGASTGRVAIVPEWLDGANLTQTTARVAINEAKANNAYCGHVLASWYGMRQVQNYIKGGAQPGLNCGDIEKFLLPLPPTKSEQEAISEALSDADALIESLEQLLAKKRQLKQGAMQELLTGKKRLPGFEVKPGYKQTEVGAIPEDWWAETIDAVAFVTSGKRLPAGYSLTEHETPHPYIRVTDMRPGTVALSDIKFVPVEAFPAISRYRIYKEDIFISVAGTLGIVGKIPPKLDGANLTENADRITRITCSQDYLLHVLMSPLIQDTIDSLQTVGAQPKLALTRIRKFVVPLPPTKAEQEGIAAILSDMDAEIAALEAKLAKARLLKQGMMQELLTGRIRLV